MISAEFVDSLRRAELSVSDVVKFPDKIQCANKGQLNYCIKLLLKVNGVLSHERNIIEN